MTEPNVKESPPGLSVIGLGKLGLCTAACFALKGFKVWGWDSDSAVIESLKQGFVPVNETGLEEVTARAGENLTPVHDVAQALNSSEVTFIIVPTPSLPSGHFDNSSVISVLEQIGPALAVKKGFHVVCVVSTVMPGSMDDIFRPALEASSGKKCGRDFGLVYNPEFIALGSVIKNFLNPDLVLLGSSDDRSIEIVRRVYEATCENTPLIAVMSAVNAEIAKLSLNCYVTLKISFANELSGLCQNIPGADIDVITRAMGADSRIGLKGLKGGMGFGGPCFPRDVTAFKSAAEKAGANVSLPSGVRRVNSGVLARLYSIIQDEIPDRGRRIAVLGLSYKPHTHIVEESQAIELARMLAEDGRPVAVSDPAAIAEARKALGDIVEYASDPYECVREAALIVLAADWPEYGKLDWHLMREAVGGRAVLLDCWRTWRGFDLKGFRYIGLGLGPELQT